MLATNTAKLKTRWLQRITTAPMTEYTRTFAPVSPNAQEDVEDELTLKAAIEETRNQRLDTYPELDDFLAGLDV